LSTEYRVVWLLDVGRSLCPVPQPSTITAPSSVVVILIVANAAEPVVPLATSNSDAPESAI
jgi:hypothetical protein